MGMCPGKINSPATTLADGIIGHRLLSSGSGATMLSGTVNFAVTGTGYHKRDG